MTNIPLNYLPGVCKVDSPYSDSVKGMGRFTDMDKTRFVAGLPEGIWNFLISNAAGAASGETSDTLGSYVPKGAKVFRDNSANIYAAYGTVSHLYYYPITAIDPTAVVPISGNTSNIDITPLRYINSGTLGANPLFTVGSTADLVVQDVAHGLAVGDWVYLSASATIAGLTISGYYSVIQVVDADNYAIRTGIANATVTGGGGTVTYNYPTVTLSSPFTTSIGSPNVTVAHTAHGSSIGDYVTIAGASAVGGITPSGEYRIASVPNANSYVIVHGSNATSTVAGGGGSPNFRYNIATGTIGGEDARIWSLDNYGAQLLASPYNGTIYVWEPDLGGRAYPLLNAPDNVLAMFVTPERFVFALGRTSTGATNPATNGPTPGAMVVSWPDQDNYTDWTPSATNTANSRTLQEGSKLAGGIAVRDGVSLVFTDAACYAFTYTGDNFIYNSTIAGRKCGIPGPLAVAVMEGIAYWFSGAEFWTWNGSVQRLPSDDIRDYVVTDLYTAEMRSIVVGAHTAKKEVWFSYNSLADYQSNAYLANTRYVIFHVDQSCWANGTFHITSWVDSGLLPCPLFAAWSPDFDSSSFNSLDFGVTAGSQLADIGTGFIQFSPIDISKGDRNMDVFAFIPDFKTLTGSGMTLTMLTQDYPQDTPATIGTFSITSSTRLVGMRFGAKLVGYKLTTASTAATIPWRLGLPRLEVQPAGARR